MPRNSWYVSHSCVEFHPLPWVAKRMRRSDTVETSRSYANQLNQQTNKSHHRTHARSVQSVSPVTSHRIALHPSRPHFFFSAQHV